MGLTGVFCASQTYGEEEEEHEDLDRTNKTLAQSCFQGLGLLCVDLLILSDVPKEIWLKIVFLASRSGDGP